MVLRSSGRFGWADSAIRSEEHTSELQSLAYLVCRLLLEKKKKLPSRHRAPAEPPEVGLPPSTHLACSQAGRDRGMGSVDPPLIPLELSRQNVTKRTRTLR